MKITNTYQGSPCKRAGHTERYVRGKACVACMLADKKKQWAENPEKQKARDKNKYAKNPEKYNADFKKRRAKNPKKYAAYQKKYQLANLNVFRYHTSLHRKRIKEQTPPWAVGCKKVKEIYLTCPKGYDVDHRHSLVKGGLHVWWNLKAIPLSENRSKGSKIL